MYAADSMDCKQVVARCSFLLASPRTRVGQRGVIHASMFAQTHSSLSVCAHASGDLRTYCVHTPSFRTDAPSLLFNS